MLPHRPVKKEDDLHEISEILVRKDTVQILYMDTHLNLFQGRCVCLGSKLPVRIVDSGYCESKVVDAGRGPGPGSYAPPTSYFPVPPPYKSHDPPSPYGYTDPAYPPGYNNNSGQINTRTLPPGTIHPPPSMPPAWQAPPPGSPPPNNNPSMPQPDPPQMFQPNPPPTAPSYEALTPHRPPLATAPGATGSQPPPAHLPPINNLPATAPPNKEGL
ncbi:extensin-like [Haliotis rufescens]|uniref:extensin-like n=1 Tax=Haliotis rufescens TaxID=6454 RepID=UPI00201F954E|nr:extensin-like [Haliotis rufescens]